LTSAVLIIIFHKIYEKQKLLDLRLEELIEKADYELKYIEICAKIELSQRKIAELSETDQARANVQERLNTFRKTLSEKQNYRRL